MKLIPCMNKQLKKDLYKVMGKKVAKRELNKVWEVRPEMFLHRHRSIAGLFTWADTPQGYEFWSQIHTEIIKL
jgi:hypothetical protein